MVQKEPGKGPIGAAAGLGFAAVLGVLLMLLCYLRLAGYLNTAAFHDPKVVAETLTEPLWRTRLGLNIVLFALAQLVLHLSFGVLCWLVARLSECAWPAAKVTRRQWIVIWLLLGTCWLLAANATHFPRSLLGAPYKAIGDVRIFGLALDSFIGMSLVVAVIVTTLVALLRLLGPRRLTALIGGGAVLLVATGFLLHAGAEPAIRRDRPNIILLGIDSLRPDMATARTTPHVRAFLDQSLQMTDAVTPLARTFPSWVSILSGRHPHTTGAVMNLLPRNLIHEGRTLPTLLREQGYHTVYAIDETRFSNVDASYGFDDAETPVIGGSDFVLAWFSDTPLSNVIVNTRLGALLFPFQYANRAAFVTYQPDSFVHRIDHALDSRQPLFLALHLTLPHWPFEWSDSRELTEAQTADHEASTRGKYRDTAQRADRQFGDILAVLERKGLLKNAIVIALSDHGEAFGADDDFLEEALPGDDKSLLSAQESGHGTSVFSPHQYHTVLGFRAYGAATALLPAPHLVTEPVSMLDIAPTVLDLLRLPATEPLDGQSMLPLFRSDPGAAQQFAGRIRFTESEYNPRGLDTSHMTASAIAAAAMAYHVNARTDRLEVRTDMLGVVMSTRQYAALVDGSFAAAVPKDSGGGPYRFVYKPRTAHEDPKQAERLRQAMEKRFGIEFSGETTAIKPQS